MLTTYREALALPGAWRFSAASFIARQPISMIGLGIVIYISGITDSYAEAGVLAAAFQITAAACALITSRWVDRYGQRRVLPPLAIAHAIGLFAFIAVVQAGAPLIVQALVVAAAGASQPSIAAVVRARWAFVVQRDGRPDQMRTAFAIESLVDEIIFTIGPLLVAYMALNLSLPSPLVLAALLSVIGVLLLAIQRATEPPATPVSAHEHRGGSAIRQPGLLVAVVSALGLGFVFGAYEVSTVAFATKVGQPSATGLILALWAIGSLLGGLWFGARHWHIRLPNQALACLLILAVILVPIPFIGSVPLLAVMTLVSGAAVAPALIASFSLAERLVPAALLTEGLTWSSSGLALGVSGGSAVAGVVIDAAGTSAAYTLPIAGAGFAALVIATRRSTLLAHVQPYQPSEPTVVPVTDPVPGPAPGAILDDAG